jgi:deoxyribodipyrimidine photolyase-related protein
VQRAIAPLPGEKNGLKYGKKSSIAVNDVNEIKTKTMSKINILFPHQLFKDSPLMNNGLKTYLIEEYLFFNQYPFHKQKLAFHRASMKIYEQFLCKQGMDVIYIDAQKDKSDIRKFIEQLEGVEEVHYIDPTDYYLEKRIKEGAASKNIQVHAYDNPLFINSRESLHRFFKKDKKKFFQTSFYKDERKRLQLLVDQDNNPIGGKWTFDTENRKRYPKSKTPPSVQFPSSNTYYEEAKSYVSKNYPDNYGTLDNFPLYPVNHEGAEAWLKTFLEQRFHEFGAYEDAVVKEAHILNHSVLSPLINVGLLKPLEVVQDAIDFADKHEVPINSTEGFVRQIIGWREFIRGIYEVKGVEERTKNFWGFSRKIPPSFYKGETGIPPIDQTIKKLLKTAYNHHIERLMLLGNFMVLCEFDPNEVYQWFMEMYIDAYDWVMVTNVYGMSQFADGGLMSTKPYISSSNYVLKMSNYQKGDWTETWDALFWRFMDVNREFFLKNPRLGMLIRTFDKMSDEKKEAIRENSQAYLDKLDQELAQYNKA